MAEWEKVSVISAVAEVGVAVGSVNRCRGGPWEKLEVLEMGELHSSNLPLHF